MQHSYLEAGLLHRQRGTTVAKVPVPRSSSFESQNILIKEGWCHLQRGWVGQFVPLQMGSGHAGEGAGGEVHASYDQGLFGNLHFKKVIFFEIIQTNAP